MTNNIFKQKDVQLDTFIDKNVQAIASFSQGDLNSTKLIIDLSNSNADLDLTDAVDVRIDFRKPDGKLVFQYCAIDDRAKGIVSVVLTAQTVAAPGEVKAEVTVNYPGGKAVVTKKFAFHVHESIASDSSLESTNEFPMLVKAIEVGEKLDGVDIDGMVDTSKRTEEKPGLVTRPSGFPWKSAPIQIKKDAFGKYSVIFDIEKFVPAVGKAYYVDISMGASGDGLTSATAFKTLPEALAKTDAKIINIAPGVYDKDRGFGIVEASFTTTSLVLRPTYKGDVIIGGHAGVTWTADTTPKVFKAGRTNALNIYDGFITDEFGDHSELVKVASLAEVGTTPGSWYTDNVTVYVRLADDRTPTNSNVFVYTSNPNGFMRGNKTIYVEGIKFYGGTTPFEVSNKLGTDNLTAYFKNCEFKYGSDKDNSNGLSVKGARQVFLQGCVAARNPRDGFNYHEYNGINPNVIEIDCMGYNNGLKHVENNNNGSTIHELGNIIRVNGLYFNNKGPNMADVGGSNAWAVGCTAYGSKSATGSSNVNFQNQDGKTWLEGCIAYESTTDISEAGAGKVYAKRTIISNKFYETQQY